MSWKAKLQSHGLTEETAPNLVKKAIAEKNEIEREAQELKEQLKTNISEEEKEEILEALGDVPDALKEADAIILKKVMYWEKMKDTWAGAAERFKESKKGRGRPPKNTAEQGQQVAQPKPQTQQAPPQPPSNPKVIELEAEEIKPSKKSGFGKIGVFLLLGVLSFGAYNYLKNNDWYPKYSKRKAARHIRSSPISTLLIYIERQSDLGSPLFVFYRFSHPYLQWAQLP